MASVLVAAAAQAVPSANIPLAIIAPRQNFPDVDYRPAFLGTPDRFVTDASHH
jgi:hypothetical protein